MEIESMKEAKVKTSPIGAFYNFDEFFYALSVCLASALGLAKQAITSPVTQCPLSAQEVQILLRQAMISFFGNHFAQDIYLPDPLNQLVPFCVGPNGTSPSGGKIVLPTVIAENIRCCQRKIKTINTFGSESAFDIVSILTRPSDQPQLGNFIVSFDDTLLYAPQVGPDINLIDLSVVVGNTTEFLTATGEIFDLQVTMWNEWIATLQSNLSPLSTLSVQPGIAILQTSLLTRSIILNEEGWAQARKKKDPKVKPEKKN